MNIISVARKITKVADELIFYLLRAGSRNLKLDIQQDEEKYTIVIDSAYPSESRQAIRSLERMLLEANRDRSIEEEYWELMGMNGARYDSELQLVGMLIDNARVEIGDRTIHIELERFL